jgi:replicative superfamily II helicase
MFDRQIKCPLLTRQANSLVNAAIDDLSIGKLGVVVMDELHMIDDESRGYILELMATKLLSLEQEVQIIGEWKASLANVYQQGRRFMLYDYHLILIFSF